MVMVSVRVTVRVRVRVRIRVRARVRLSAPLIIQKNNFLQRATNLLRNRFKMTRL